MASIAFGTTTLPVGSTTLPQLTVTGAHSVSLSLDRTAAGALNTLTSATVITVQLETFDGSTWDGDNMLTDTGGVRLDKNSNPMANMILTSYGLNPVAAAIRVVCTVTGPSSVVTSGTLTTS